MGAEATIGSTSMTLHDMERSEWSTVHNDLAKAREYLSKDGCNHTWLDGSIELAKERAAGRGTYADRRAIPAPSQIDGLAEAEFVEDDTSISPVPAAG